MGIGWNSLFAHRALKMKTSEIREFFKLTERPEIISFAGGFPCADYFPQEQISQEIEKILAEEGCAALQYGPTEGSYELRAYLSQKMQREGIQAEIDNIIITNGSQQGLDLISKIFLNPGDVVIVEEPGYVGGLGAVNNYEAERVAVSLDSEGIRTDLLDDVLARLKREGKTIKFIYLVPNFQNPTGISMSYNRRRDVLALARQYNLLVIEDNPYGELRYEGEAIPTIKSMDTEGRVIYLGSFSKTFIPGIRVGWVVAETHVIERMITAKQATDLCSSSLGQRLAYRFAVSGAIDRHVSSLIEKYRRKRDLMLEGMQACFPREVSWTRPKGGFFIWVTLPPYMNSHEVLLKALQRGVAYVDGAGFFVNGNGRNTGRFAFSEARDDEIVEGIRRIGELLKHEISSKVQHSSGVEFSERVQFASGKS